MKSPKWLFAVDFLIALNTFMWWEGKGAFYGWAALAFFAILVITIARTFWGNDDAI